MKGKDILLLGALVIGGLFLYKMFTGESGFGGGSYLQDEGEAEPQQQPLPFQFGEAPFMYYKNGEQINIEGIMPTKTNYGAVKVFPTVTDYLVKQGIKQVYVSRGELMTPKRQMLMTLSQKLTPIEAQSGAGVRIQPKISLYDIIKKAGG